MKKVKRERNIPIKFRVTEAEKKKILDNSKKAGIKYYTNYIRKMALHGLILKKDYSELINVSGALGQIGYEFNQIGNNINQIAKKVNENGKRIFCRNRSRYVKIGEILNANY